MATSRPARTTPSSDTAAAESGTARPRGPGRPGRLRATTAVAAVAVAAVLPLVGGQAAAAAPVCAPPVPTELCGGRVFPEPLASATALTLAETRQGLEALAEEFPDWVTYDEFGASADGNTLLRVDLTAPADQPGALPLGERKVVLVSQSIHGNEPGGREGGPRWIEDVLRAGDDDPRRDLLGRVRVVQAFVNPDGWQAGDHDALPDGDSAGLWARGNGSGVGVADLGGTDLNRQAPWRGIIPDGREPESQPESKAFADLVRGLAADGDIQASTDIHGEVTDAAAWIMLSSGQFDLQGSMTQLAHGEAVAAAVDEALDADLLVELGAAINGSQPSLLTASSEFGPVDVGGSGSGFQGDWIAQAEGGDSASISTIELFNLEGLPVGGPGLNSLTARGEILQLYRDTVAAIMDELLLQGTVEHSPRLVGTGAVAWVDDFPRVEDPVRGVDVTAARFFEQLDPFVVDGLDRLTPAELTDEVLADYRSVVVGTDALAGDVAARSALRRWVDDGGNLVATDAALRLVPALLGGVQIGAVQQRIDAIGQVTYDREHPLAGGIREVAFMNTEAATIGHRVTGGGSVPTFGIPLEQWESAGGTVAGTSDGLVSVGEAPVGDGTVRTIGVLLPTPRAEGRILFGINDHGVLDTGYRVLANALGGSIEVATVAPDGEALVLDLAETRVRTASGVEPVGDGRPSPWLPAGVAGLVAALVLVAPARRS